MAGLPQFITSVPDYEVVRGHMHISIGEVVLVCSVNDFLVGCAKGKAAIITWEQERQSTAEIVQFPRADQSGH